MKSSPFSAVVDLTTVPGRSRYGQRNVISISSRMQASPRLFRRKDEHGVALVLVLGLLVLVSGLIMGFLMRSTTERSETGTFFESSRTDNLADHAVSIVQAQVAHASGNENGWASQPGMVRTFTKDGDLQHGYKLFSDSVMVIDRIDSAAISGMVGGFEKWNEKPAVFTDLNAPVLLNSAGSTIQERSPVYPIIDAKAINGGIDGFSVDTTTVGQTDLQPIPMPAKWLYVLKDGTTVAAVEGSEKITVPGATKTNPIVGRIAFWTDDETGKININTASHGFYWDIPRVFSVEDRDKMAMRQPTLREFQRYPGHPATTSLWPVLRHIYASDDEFSNAILGSPGQGGLAGISPRVVGGGSKGGTVTATEPISLINPPPRLYSSVEELLFLPDRSPQSVLTKGEVEKAKFFLTAHSQAPEVNLYNLPRMAIWPINVGSKNPSTLDALIKFCSTISSVKYYLIRNDSLSGINDMGLEDGHNRKLYSYITSLMGMPVPGYGNRSFKDKYDGGESNQIATEILDYVRSSNLYSTALGASPYTGTGAANEMATLGSRVGQVTPLKIGDAKGFGRLPILSKAVFQLYVCGVRTNKGQWAPTVTSGPTRVFDEKGIKPKSGDLTEAGLAALLEETGVGGKAELLTNAVVYFDTFDPNFGYTYPRYNFDIEVTFSGNWTVDGVSVNLPITKQTISVKKDHASLYDAKTNGNKEIWMGRFLGGTLGPHWIMQNYSSVKQTGGYPLVSSVPFSIHAPLTIEDANAGGTGEARPTLKGAILPNAEKMNFSGGTVEAKIKVGNEVVQTYTFNFPSATRPKPSYAPRTHLPSGTATGSFAPFADETVLKQLSISSDFRNRLQNQPMAYYIMMPTSVYIGIADFGLTPPYDTVFALEPAWGDKRLIAAKSTLTSGADAASGASFVPHKDYSNASVHVAADLRTDPFGVEKKSHMTRFGRRAGRILDITYGQNAMPDIPSLYDHGVSGISVTGTFSPDFDNGTLHMPDDAYVNRPDEGSATDQTSSDGRQFAWYWDRPNYKAAGSGAGAGVNNQTFYSPNKQIPSAVMFGSLPTGVVGNKPWQTLLFRPDPGGHPGAAVGFPADHLLLDLFWMPVVEPYAISEPFATSGKVNMNYQILPYSYIHRSTGMRAVLQSQKLISIKDSDAYQGSDDPTTGYSTGSTAKGADQYKIYSEGAMTPGVSISSINYRKGLNLDETNGTLRAFEDRFANGGVFRSETEICNVSLIPEGEQYSTNFEAAYWGSRRLTGDNSREMPYAHLLPRLTTRSNTYTVFYRVQSLKKVPSTDAGEWVENRDRVVAEQRGSRTIERYIDPSNSQIPNYLEVADSNGNLTDADRLDKFYRWRILNNRIFAP